MSKRILSFFPKVISLLIGLSLVSAAVLPVPHAVNAAPGVLYAAPGGMTIGFCANWSNACTLQYALSIAVSDDEIWVMKGVHYPGSNRSDTFSLKDGVKLYGGFMGSETARNSRNWAANLTILSGDIDQNDLNADGNYIAESPTDIQGENSYHVVDGSDTGGTTVFDGFIVTAGQANDSGGGMINSSAYLHIQNTTFSGNTASVYGGAMSNGECAPTLTNVVIRGNSAQHGGGMHNYISSPVLSHVVFDGNQAGMFGGGIYSEGLSHPVLTDVTFTGNAAESSGGGLMNAGSGGATLTNVTFSGNFARTGPGGGLSNANHNNGALTNVLFTGNSAYNFGGGMFNSSSSAPTLTHVTFYSNTVTWSGGGMGNDSSSPILIDVTFDSNAAYNGGGMVNDNDSNPVLTDVTFTANSARARGGGLENLSNSDPSLTNVIFSGNSSGYFGGGMNNVSSAPILMSVNFTDNSADHLGGGINNDASSPTLTDVSFHRNTADYSGGGMANTNNSNPSLTDVTFSGNTAYGGGGIYNSNSSPTLINVAFKVNGAGQGGGMRNIENSHPTLTNIVFSGNTANDDGGAMRNDDSNPTVTNVTFWGNSANNGGGICNYRSSPTLRNAILWDNSAVLTGPQIDNPDASTPIISYSDIQGSGGSGSGWDPALGADNGSNIDAAPLFMDVATGDLRLQLISPAIDAGDNDAVPSAVTTDLGGHPRFVDLPTILDRGNGAAPIVDMGAYEAQFVDVMLNKSISPASAVPGQAITLALTLSNGGSITATHVVITDTLSLLEEPAFASTLLVTETGHLPPYAWMVQDLAPGQSGVITVTGVLTVPLPAGTYTNTATITADADLLADNNTATETFTVLNVPPGFTSTPVIVAVQDAPYNYTATVEDINGDALILTAPILPAWLTFTDHGDGTATLSGVPSKANVGINAVELLATDGGGLRAMQTSVITVWSRIYLPLLLRNAP